MTLSERFVAERQKLGPLARAMYEMEWFGGGGDWERADPLVQASYYAPAEAALRHFGFATAAGEVYCPAENAVLVALAPLLEARDTLALAVREGAMVSAHDILGYVEDALRALTGQKGDDCEDIS